MESLRELDAFTKIDPSHCKPSFTGAVTTVVMYSLVFLLTLHQVVHYFTSTTVTYKNMVDATNDGVVPVQIDIVVGSPCSKLCVELTEVGLQAVDITNQLQLENVQPDQSKSTRVVDEKSSDDELYNKFLQKIFQFNPAESSCRIHGSLKIRKCSGFISISSQKIYISSLFGGIFLSDPSLNYSHKVNRFSFGPRVKDSRHINNGMEKNQEVVVKELRSFSYFVSIVPTRYRSLLTDTTTYQHSVSQFVKNVENSIGKPGIFVRYEFDPMSLDICITRADVRILLVRFLGIVGGIFTLSRVIYMIVDFILSKVKPSIDEIDDENEPLLTDTEEY